MASLGEMLQAARRQAALTVEEAAETTRIPREHLIALEADDLGGLPPGPYGRGFIRIYAGALKVPVEPLLEAYSLQTAVAGYTIESTSRSGPARGAGLPVGIVLALVALAVIVVVVIVNRTDGQAAAGTTEGAPNLPATDQLLPGSALEIVALRTTSLEVRMDGESVFAGQLDKGSRKSWNPTRSISILAAEPDALEIFVNDDSIGLLGPAGTELERTWSVAQSPASGRPRAG